MAFAHHSISFCLATMKRSHNNKRKKRLPVLCELATHLFYWREFQFVPLCFSLRGSYSVCLPDGTLLRCMGCGLPNERSGTTAALNDPPVQSVDLAQLEIFVCTLSKSEEEMRPWSASSLSSHREMGGSRQWEAAAPRGVTDLGAVPAASESSAAIVAMTPRRPHSAAQRRRLVRVNCNPPPTTAASLLPISRRRRDLPSANSSAMPPRPPHPPPAAAASLTCETLLVSRHYDGGASSDRTKRPPHRRGEAGGGWGGPDRDAAEQMHAHESDHPDLVDDDDVMVLNLPPFFGGRRSSPSRCEACDRGARHRDAPPSHTYTWTWQGTPSPPPQPANAPNDSGVQWHGGQRRTGANLAAHALCYPSSDVAELDGDGDDGMTTADAARLPEGTTSPGCGERATGDSVATPPHTATLGECSLARFQRLQQSLARKTPPWVIEAALRERRRTATLERQRCVDAKIAATVAQHRDEQRQKNDQARHLQRLHRLRREMSDDVMHAAFQGRTIRRIDDASGTLRHHADADDKRADPTAEDRSASREGRRRTFFAAERARLALETAEKRLRLEEEKRLSELARAERLRQQRILEAATKIKRWYRSRRNWIAAQAELSRLMARRKACRLAIAATVSGYLDRRAVFRSRRQRRAAIIIQCVVRRYQAQRERARRHARFETVIEGDVQRDKSWCAALFEGYRLFTAANIRRKRRAIVAAYVARRRTEDARDGQASVIRALEAEVHAIETMSSRRLQRRQEELDAWEASCKVAEEGRRAVALVEQQHAVGLRFAAHDLPEALLRDAMTEADSRNRCARRLQAWLRCRRQWFTLPERQADDALRWFAVITRRERWLGRAESRRTRHREWLEDNFWNTMTAVKRLSENKEI